MSTLSARWQGLTDEVRPVIPLLVIQFMTGAWILPQLSFFPIYLEEQLRFTSFTLAAVVAAGQAAGLIAALYGGRLSDTLGSKRVLVLGLIGGTLVSLVFVVQQPLVVAALWMIGGVAGSLNTLGGSSYLTRAVSPQRLGVLSALFALCMTMGGALSSPFIGNILDTSGFGLYGLIGVVVVATTAFVAAFFLPAQRVGGDSEEEARVSMWTMAARPIVQLLMGIRFLPTVYYGMQLVLVPLLINELAGNKTTVAIYGSLSLVVASGAQLLAGRAADRYGHRTPTLISFGLLVVAAVGLALFSRDLWGVFTFGILGLAMAWVLSSLLFVLVSDGVPRSEHGRTFGLLHATWSIAMISGSLLGGALVRIGPSAPFLAAAALNCLSIVLTLAFFRRVQSSPAV